LLKPDPDLTDGIDEDYGSQPMGLLEGRDKLLYLTTYLGGRIGGSP